MGPSDASGQEGEIHRIGSRMQQPGGWWRRLWDRELDHSPEATARFGYLGIVVLAAIVLYYEFYIPAAVTPSITAHYHMSWHFFVYVIVVGNAIGAIASIIAGLADRWGRANIVAYGLLVTGLVTLFGIPNAPNLWVYGIMYSVLGFVEGMALVATPALVRDFSPQMGRATAMGFWTMGPVVGMLVVTEVSSNTLNHLHAWQDQFIICGIVGLVAFVIALVGLRELAPRIRDQLMVTEHDRVLVEARAAGVDVQESLKHPWKQMLHLDIAAPSLGIGMFLVVYYTLIAFSVVYLASIFNYTQQRANALGNWMWAFNAGALVVVGVLSDRLRVRKPFMAIGIVGAVVATMLFASHTTHAGTSYYTFVWILSLLAVCLGTVIAPWLAAFTETIESRNPALAATGLAIMGWMLRVVVAASLFILPYVVTSMTPIMERGVNLQAIEARYPAEVQTLSAISAPTLAQLNVASPPASAVTTAVGEISRGLKVTPAVALQRLLAVNTAKSAHPADFAYLARYAPSVQAAQKVAPKEWQRWWWVSMGCEAALLPLLLLMRGRWDPRKARRDEEEHEHWVEQELAKFAA